MIYLVHVTSQFTEYQQTSLVYRWDRFTKMGPHTNFCCAGLRYQLKPSLLMNDWRMISTNVSIKSSHSLLSRWCYCCLYNSMMIGPNIVKACAFLCSILSHGKAEDLVRTCKGPTHFVRFPVQRPRLSSTALVRQKRQIRIQDFCTGVHTTYSLAIRSSLQKGTKKGTKSCHFRVKYFCIVGQLCEMVRALTFSYNHQKKVLTIILAIMFGLVVSNSIEAYSHIICALVLLLPKNIFCPSKGTRRNGRFLRRRTGLPPFPFATQTTLKILTELLCKPLTGRAPTMNKEFLVPRKGQNQDYGYGN